MFLLSSRSIHFLALLLSLFFLSLFRCFSRSLSQVNAEKCTCFPPLQGKCVVLSVLSDLSFFSLSLAHSHFLSLLDCRCFAPLSVLSSCMDVLNVYHVKEECYVVCWCRSTRMLRILYLSWSYVEWKCFLPDKWHRNWISNETGNIHRKQAIR